MKNSILNLIAVTLVASLSASIAQSKFSGIYSGKSSTGPKFLAAITKGGRVLGIDSTSEGLGDALNPAKSTINASGKLKGVTPSGTSITATVNSSFKINGTIKTSEGTARLSGKRTFN